jgi:N-methylhydantoinase B
LEGAARDYGVLVTGTPDRPVLDEPASDELRATRRAEADPGAPFFDRGPGYARLSGGAPAADVDWR